MATSTPNSGSTRPRPRIVKPSTANSTSPTDPDTTGSGPKPVRGKRKSSSGRLPSNSPILTTRQQLLGSPITSLRSPLVAGGKNSPQGAHKNSPQGVRKSSVSSVPSSGVGVRRHSMTPDKTSTAAANCSPSTKSEGNYKLFVEVYCISQ